MLLFLWEGEGLMIILYTTGCPRCKILAAKLDRKNIQYSINSDSEEMIKKGFITAPMLEVNGEVMDFSQANKWVEEQ
jgi:glutaredoxin